MANKSRVTLQAGAKGADYRGIKTETAKIAELTPNPDNARHHDAADIVGIANSLRQFGQQTPIVVTADDIIVKGNGTHEAARMLGWTEIVIVRTKLTGHELTAYAIADNQVAQIAVWDTDTLISQLKELNEFDLTELGFTDLDLIELLGETDDTHSNEGSGGDPDPVHNTKDYLESQTKKFEILFSQEQHEQVTQDLQRLKDRLDADNNTEALLRLLEHWDATGGYDVD